MTPTEITQLARMSSALRYLSKTAAGDAPLPKASPAAATKSISKPPEPSALLPRATTTTRKPHKPSSPSSLPPPAVPPPPPNKTHPYGWLEAGHPETYPTRPLPPPANPTPPKHLRRAVANNAYAAGEFNSRLHRTGLQEPSPRDNLAEEIARQSGRVVPWMSPNGLKMLRERNTGVMDRLRSRLDGSSRRTTQPMVARPGGKVYVNEVEPPLNGGVKMDSEFPASDAELRTARLLGYPTLANHALEIVRQPIYYHKLDNPLRDANQVGPAIGDLVFAGEQFKRDNGKPLRHTVRLPSGSEHDINWMIDRAKEHGYFEGKSMHDLIFGTPEGQQWYKQQIESKLLRPPPPQLAPPIPDTWDDWKPSPIDLRRLWRHFGGSSATRGGTTQPSRPLWQRIFPPLPEGARPGQGW